MTISPQAIILPFQDFVPQIDEGAFVAAGTVIIGNVVIGAESSIWPGCVLRGDVGPIRVGKKSNIQDGTVMHVTEGAQGCFVGDNVTVGHMSLLHECEVRDGGFVGMRATLLDGAVMESCSMLAAGALLTQGKTVPTGQVWAGSPAKYWRDIKPEEAEEFAARAPHYADLASQY